MAGISESKDIEEREAKRLMGNIDAALLQYRADVQKHPEYVHAVNELDRFYRAHNRTESADDLLRTAKQLVEHHGKPGDKRGVDPALSNMVVKRQRFMSVEKPSLIRRIFRPKRP